MMAMKALLLWMYDEDRTVGYVGRMSGIDGRRIIDLVAGIAPTDEEVSTLAAVTGIAPEDLTGPGPDGEWGIASLDPLYCYAIAEAAKILNVSVDTVRAEIRSGDLEHVVLGSRAYRIPRWALEKRLARPGRGRDAAGP